MLSIQPQIRPSPYVDYWMVASILIPITLLFYIYLYSPNAIILPIRSLIDHRVRRELKESRNSFQARILNLLNIIFYFSFTFVLYFLIKDKIKSNILKEYFFQSKYLDNDFVLFLLLFISVFLVVFLKKQVFMLIAYIFDETERYWNFTFNMEMFIKTMGILILPFIFVFIFKWTEKIFFLQIVFFSNLTLYFLFLLKSFFELPKKAFVDYLNFILYLCGLEIIPLLFVLKFFFD